MILKVSDAALWVFGLAAVLFVALGMASDKAASAEWTGIHGSVNAGYSASQTDLTFTDGVNSLGVNGLGGDGAVAGFGIGFDARAQNFVVGVFADYTWHEDSEFAVTANVQGLFSGNVAAASIDNEWAVGVRAGYLITPDVLAYGLIGYGSAEMSNLSVLPGTPAAMSFDTPDFHGVVLGGGLEASLGGGWFLKGEYRYADYESETIGIVPGLDLKLDPDTQSGRVGLIYRFNTPNLSQ